MRNFRIRNQAPLAIIPPRPAGSMVDGPDWKSSEDERRTRITRTRAFYAELLGCTRLDSGRNDLDLYEFDGGFVLGLFFVPADQILSDTDYERATWMELKVDDPAAWKTRLQAFGVREITYPDPTRFFFAAPGGQVFRLAPLDGGL